MIESLLNDVVLDGKNPQKLYALAEEYDRLEQGAAAATFYLRAADNEYTDKILQYKANIKLANIYLREGNRFQSVISIMHNAIKVLPTRPEAYYFLSKWHQDRDEWRPSYMLTSIGLQFTHHSEDIGVDYPGKEGLEWLHARAEWKDNGTDVGKKLLFDLKFKSKLNKEIYDLLSKDIDNIGYPSTITYNSNDYSMLRHQFRGTMGVTQNYDRHFQDLFLLSVLVGNTNGTFVELGSGDPIVQNATYLLEKDFGWSGLSVEIQEKFCYEHSRKRNSTILMADAGSLNYEDLFRSHCLEEYIDFLRINAESQSLNALSAIPFDKHEFNIIQFQHNACWWGEDFMKRSRKLLSEKGYILCVPNVATDEKQNYEDWWVHPNCIKKEFKTNKKVNFIWNYMMHGFMEM